MLIFLTLDGQDISQFNYIYEKYKNTVYAIIFRYVKDKGLAEDTMQEVFLRFFKTMGKLQTEEDRKRWLFRIAKNASLDCVDKDGRYKNNIDIWLDDDEIVTDFLDKTADSPLDEALKMELARKISETLETLKPIHSDVIYLNYYFGYTVDEIAKMTNVPVHTVYSRLAKAKSLLLTKLSFIKDEYIELIGDVFNEKK